MLIGVADATLENTQIKARISWTTWRMCRQDTEFTERWFHKRGHLTAPINYSRWHSRKHMSEMNSLDVHNLVARLGCVLTTRGRGQKANKWCNCIQLLGRWLSGHILVILNRINDAATASRSLYHRYSETTSWSETAKRVEFRNRRRRIREESEKNHSLLILWLIF